MSAPKFTPGPWEVATEDPGPMYAGTIAVVSDSPYLYVVLGSGHPLTRVPPEQWDANADLIAAGPELYEALRDLLHEDGPSRNSWARARAALAKAEGSP